MTIEALAFRAAERITALGEARRNQRLIRVPYSKRLQLRVTTGQAAFVTHHCERQKFVKRNRWSPLACCLRDFILASMLAIAGAWAQSEPAENSGDSRD